MEESQLALLQDARLINACESLIFPMLQQEIDLAVVALTHKFQNGEPYVNEAATVTALKNFKLKLEHAQRKGNRVQEKLDKENQVKKGE